MASSQTNAPIFSIFKLIGRLIAVLLIIAILALGALFAINITVISSTTDDLWQSHELKDKHADYIVVLGAGLDENGQPSPMLAERLNKGIELYRLKAGQKILLSGDDDRAYYNEVKAMKKYLIAKKIDPKAIITDPDGASTYASITRLGDTFGANSVIIVSQKYHLYRSLYIAKHTGLKAYGVPADIHPWVSQERFGDREFFARIKDFCQVHTRKAPPLIQDIVASAIEQSTDLSKNLL